MAESFLTPEGMQRLLRSRLWQEEYLPFLLQQYDSVAKHVDATPDDHRFWQGLKKALAFAIETPRTRSPTSTVPSSGAAPPGRAPARRASRRRQRHRRRPRQRRCRSGART
jgi:hypothetical protein